MQETYATWQTYWPSTSFFMITDTETTTGQGNISNKQQQSSECGGTGSGKCPPGQF